MGAFHGLCSCLLGCKGRLPLLLLLLLLLQHGAALHPGCTNTRSVCVWGSGAGPEVCGLA